MKIYAGYPIHQQIAPGIPCPECNNDSAWLPVMDFEEEELTVACRRSSCQATVRRSTDYGEMFNFETQIRVLIKR